LASRILVEKLYRPGSVVSIDPGVYLNKKFLALGNGNALHENASFRRAVFVELAVDHGECFGSSGDPASCISVLG